jgi:hypothetical protein
VFDIVLGSKETMYNDWHSGSCYWHEKDDSLRDSKLDELAKGKSSCKPQPKVGIIINQ